jgi:hypothetical protein
MAGDETRCSRRQHQTTSRIDCCFETVKFMVTGRKYLGNPSAEALDSPQFCCSFPVNVRQSNVGDHDVILSGMLRNLWLMRGLTKHLDISRTVKGRVLNHQRETKAGIGFFLLTAYESEMAAHVCQSKSKLANIQIFNGGWLLSNLHQILSAVLNKPNLVAWILMARL